MSPALKTTNLREVKFERGSQRNGRKARRIWVRRAQGGEHFQEGVVNKRAVNGKLSIAFGHGELWGSFCRDGEWRPNFRSWDGEWGREGANGLSSPGVEIPQGFREGRDLLLGSWERHWNWPSFAMYFYCLPKLKLWFSSLHKLWL